MANTYPLANKGPTQFTGTTPSATTDQAEAYRNMLGPEAASEDVGLFYQLNQVVAAIDTDVTNAQSGTRSLPIEANAQYA